jgi:hypothetical protein
MNDAPETVPEAWEVNSAWRNATLDAKEVAAILKVHAGRVRRALESRCTRENWGIPAWRSPDGAAQAADDAERMLREVERIAGHLRWLHDKAAAAANEGARKSRPG